MDSNNLIEPTMVSKMYNEEDNYPKVTKLGDNEYNYICEDGELLLDKNYLNCRPFRSGYAAIESSEGWNLIDATGQLVLHRWYDEVTDVFPIALVRSGFDWGQVNIDLTE